MLITNRIGTNKQMIKFQAYQKSDHAVAKLLDGEVVLCITWNAKTQYYKTKRYFIVSQD